MHFLSSFKEPAPAHCVHARVPETSPFSARLRPGDSGLGQPFILGPSLHPVPVSTSYIDSYAFLMRYFPQNSTLVLYL